MVNERVESEEATTYTIRYERKLPAEQYGHGALEITATVSVQSLAELQQRIWGLQRVVNERMYLSPPWRPRNLDEAQEGRADGMQMGGGHSPPQPVR